MHILLPPSETKRSGGVGVFAADALAHREALGLARERVRAALEALCADPEAAAAALKLGAKSRGELAHNLALASSGAMPAIERYTGVLYDALDVRALGARARRWVAANVSVQSALFGLVGAEDAIPAYRLSAGSRLPALGAPLKRVWREAHERVDRGRLGWVLDLRSKDYVELAPLPAGAPSSAPSGAEPGAFLDVVQRGPGGEVRALNHFNKAAKGDLVRRLAATGARIAGADDLLAWAEREGLELVRGSDPGRLTLVTELTAGSAGSAGARRSGAAAASR